MEAAFKTGRSVHSPTLTFKFVLNKSDLPPKISFVVPKSVAKLAVKRNFLRRRGYQALFPYFKHFPQGIFGVFLFKKAEDSIPTIEEEIKNILKKL